MSLNSTLVPNKTMCFYCYKPVGLDQQVIDWMGQPHSIYMHVSCTTELLLHLASDVVKAGQTKETRQEAHARHVREEQAFDAAAGEDA